MQLHVAVLFHLLLLANGISPIREALLAAADRRVDMEQQVVSLKARVAASLAEEQRLSALNKELHHEVNSWEDVGKKVLSREAHVMQTIAHPNDEASLRAAVLAELSAPTPGAQAPTSQSMLSTAASVKEPTSADTPSFSVSLASWQALVCMFTVVVVVAFIFWRVPVKGAGFLNRQRHLHINELQLEGASLHFGDGYLLVQPSNGLRTHTQMSGQRDGSSILRFEEVLVLSVAQGDGPCSITVMQRGEHQDLRIGTAILQATELLHCLSSGTEYHRFNVQAESSCQERNLRVAMRIRDASSIPAGQRPSANGKGLAHVL